MARLHLKALFGGLVFLILPGCLSVLPEPQSAEALYRLEGNGSITTLAQDVTIREPDAPRLLAGQAMVSADAEGRLRLLPNVEWSGRATRLLQLAMVDSYATNGGASAILPETGAQTAYEVSTRVQAFELRGEEAVCKMTLSLLHRQTRTMSATRTVTESVRAESMAVTDRARAMKQAGEACAQSGAEFIAIELSEG